MVSQPSHPDGSRAAEVVEKCPRGTVVAVGSGNGDPDVYGAAPMPSTSGVTQYVFAQLGISLPHSSSAQVASTQQVSHPQGSDLVF